MPTSTPVKYFVHISLSFTNLYITILLSVFKFLVNLDIYNVISCYTLYIFALVCILKFILIYVEGRKLENCNRFILYIFLFIHTTQCH